MIRTCATCGQKNRIGSEHLASSGRCGACKGALPPLDAPLEVDEAMFRDVIAKAQVPVLVDFWAAWCGPCKMAAPELTKLAQQEAGKAIVLKVNTEQQPNLAAQFRVSSIPNFALFRNGHLAKQQPGLMSASQLRFWMGL